MNNSLNEYLRFNFELNIELNHFLARFNVKMNNQNVSATPSNVSLASFPWVWKYSAKFKSLIQNRAKKLKDCPHPSISSWTNLRKIKQNGIPKKIMVQNKLSNDNPNPGK